MGLWAQTVLAKCWEKREFSIALKHLHPAQGCLAVPVQPKSAAVLPVPCWVWCGVNAELTSWPGPFLLCQCAASCCAVACAYSHGEGWKASFGVFLLLGFYSLNRSKIMFSLSLTLKGSEIIAGKPQWKLCQQTYEVLKQNPLPWGKVSIKMNGTKLFLPGRIYPC